MVRPRYSNRSTGWLQIVVASTKKSGLSTACKQYSNRQFVSPDAGGLREKQVRHSFCPKVWDVATTKFCCTGVVQVESAASSRATSVGSASRVSEGEISARNHSCIGDSTAGTACASTQLRTWTSIALLK